MARRNYKVTISSIIKEFDRSVYIDVRAFFSNAKFTVAELQEALTDADVTFKKSAKKSRVD